MRFRAAFVAFACLSAAAGRARALDKQGSAHGGETEGATSGFDVSGAVSLGLSLYNPTYGARPDNSGRALVRYALHADVDLVGRRLSIPVDVNVFTDRERRGAKKLGPTELDGIVGVTTTWDVATGAALELGARTEHDRPTDRGGFTQTYVDTRARILYSAADRWKKVADVLHDGDVSGTLTLGWFAVNPTYAARPDNTGKALLRYALRTEVSVWSDLFSFGVDQTYFTERSAPLRPSELDLTVEGIFHVAPWEVHLAYERDLPVDRRGLVQHFVYLLFARNFDLVKEPTRPLQDRGGVPSP